VAVPLPIGLAYRWRDRRFGDVNRRNLIPIVAQYLVKRATFRSAQRLEPLSYMALDFDLKNLYSFCSNEKMSVFSIFPIVKYLLNF
jgi:hypothetical protein